MSNLKIKDIETLELLSLEELNQVVGGMDCPGRRLDINLDKKSGNDYFAVSMALFFFYVESEA